MNLQDEIFRTQKERLQENSIHTPVYNVSDGSLLRSQCIYIKSLVKLNHSR